MTLTLGRLGHILQQSPHEPCAPEATAAVYRRAENAQNSVLGRQGTGAPFLEAFRVTGSHAATAGRSSVGAGLHTRAFPPRKKRILYGLLFIY